MHKRLGLIAVALGGGAIVALVAIFGARAIGREVLDAWWVLPITTSLLFGQLYLSGVAWRISVGRRRPSRRVYFRIRWIREAVNSMLPVAQLGGNLVGVRLLMHRGVPGTLAGAGTTLDLTIEALTQFMFTALGFVVLATVAQDLSWAPWIGGGLVTGALGIFGFIAAQRAGLLRLVEFLADRIARWFPKLSAGALRGLHAELMRLQANRANLVRAAALHLTSWLLGTLECWLALTAMGRSPSVTEALVIESLGMAVRSAGFAVPGALGVQEGGYILVCGLFGIPAETAIALSMVKRARELLVGLPGLVAWQVTEGRRILRRRAAG